MNSIASRLAEATVGASKGRPITSSLAHAIFSELEDLMLGRRAGSCRWNPLDEMTGLETRDYEQVLLQVEQELTPH